jgi:hypothetical protein
VRLTEARRLEPMDLIVRRIDGRCDATMGGHSNAVSNIEQLDTRRRIFRLLQQPCPAGGFLQRLVEKWRG